MLKECLVTFHNGGFIETGNIDSVNLTLSSYWWFKNWQNLLVSGLNWVERSHRYLSKTFTLNIRVTSKTVATSLTTRPRVTVLPFSIWTNDVPHIPNFNLKRYPQTLNRIHKQMKFWPSSYFHFSNNSSNWWLSHKPVTLSIKGRDQFTFFPRTFELWIVLVLGSLTKNETLLYPVNNAFNVPFG